MSRNGTKSRKSRTFLDQRSDLNGIKTVYFHLVTFPEHYKAPPRVKIGYSSNVTQRTKELSTTDAGLEKILRTACVVRGSMADEKHVQRYFDKYLIPMQGRKEYFWASEELLDYIRWLRDQYFVWVPDDDECAPLETLDEVESSLWMPTPERRKPAPKDCLFVRGALGDLGIPPRESTGDDFYTGATILDCAREALGAIDLDPASHCIANRNVKAARFFAKHDNGLSRPWEGRVWLNPPFSQWADWVPKILGEWNSSRVESMCVLSAMRTITAQYFEPIVKGCSGWCVIHGRMPFWGTRAGQPDDGHAIFYFGDDVQRFTEAFSKIGTCFVQSRSRI